MNVEVVRGEEEELEEEEGVEEVEVVVGVEEVEREVEVILEVRGVALLLDAEVMTTTEVVAACASLVLSTSCVCVDCPPAPGPSVVVVSPPAVLVGPSELVA